MTQEEKELLLKDLCARLPYNVMVDYDSHIYILNEIDQACEDIDYITVRIQDVERLMCAKNVMIEHIKPYLRPLSSMTEEEKEELIKNFWGSHTAKDTFEELSWYLSKHFDINGLIPKGLALEVTEENNPYKD